MAITCLTPFSSSHADAVDDALTAVRSIGAEGDGYDRAIAAASQLQKLPSSEIPRVLDGASGLGPIAENWIRGIVFAITRQSGPVPAAVLQQYVEDKSHNPIGRGIAMELIRAQDPSLAEQLIGNYLNDSSLALREMAVESTIKKAESLEESDKQKAISEFRLALQAARHPKQLERIVASLGELGDSVSTADAFSLITGWKAVAPFDNVGGGGYAKAYDPETDFAGDGKLELTASYEGKKGTISWDDVEGSADEGLVDLAGAFEKEKGAVAYLYAEFESSSDRPAEARLGCINANKVWINGKEIMANEVYHSGSMIDQYKAPVELLKGTNTVLLKICQNEQEQPWAQRWEFQFRITDPTGKGLKSGD